MKKFGYFTLATDDFVIGACCLANSLRKVTKIPLYCIGLNLTDESKIKLSSSGWEIIDTNYLGSNTCKHQSYRSNPNFASNCYNKLYLWQQDFDKVIYLDADMICLKNIDHLFDIESSFSACPGLMSTINLNTKQVTRLSWTFDRFNAGFLVVSPNKKKFIDLFVAKDLVSTPEDPTDQGLLNYYFSKDWNRLSPLYNMPKRFFDTLPNKWNEYKSKIYILHYTVEKPWNFSREKDLLTNLWWSFSN